MSKIISIQGNQSFNDNFQVTTDLPVNIIRGKDFTLTQKQLVTYSGSNDDFGSGCSISNNGLWLVTGAYATSNIYTFTRNNITENFVFSSYISSTSCSETDISEDGKYIIVESPADSCKIYARNTTTNAWSHKLTLADHLKVAMSPDGSYAVAMDPNKNTSFSVTPFRRTPGTDTWTALTGFSPSTTTAATSVKKTIDISNNGERIVFITNGGTEIWRRVTDTTYTLEQTLGSGNNVNVRINKTGDLILTENNVYSRTGVTWSLEVSINEPSYGTAVSSFASFISMSNNGNRLILYDNATVNTKVGRFSIYDKLANNNWQLIATLDSLVSELGQSSASLVHSFDMNEDGSILVTSGLVSGIYVYDIDNEVTFNQRIKTNLLSFNDTLKIAPAFGSADHLVTLPPSNQAGALVNDGTGILTWGSPFDQNLNKSDNPQFDTLSISPALGGDVNSYKKLCLSMRLLNTGYSGYCVKVRRNTDFTVDLVSDVDLDSNTSISGTPAYSSTSGSSLRGQITATLVDTTGSGLIVDGTQLGPDSDGIVRILLVGQTNPEENGIYTTTISTEGGLILDRATDFDEDSEVFENQTFYVTLGDTYINTGFQLTTTDPVIIGGTGGSNLTFNSIEVLKDIGFSNGTIDLATLTTFLDNADGYVHTWYDQSGNGNNFTQEIQSKQPLLKLTEGINWLPTVEFDGTDDYLDGGDILDIGESNGLLVNMVAQVSTEGGNLINKGSGINSWGIAYGSTGSGTIDFRYYDSVDSSSSTSANPNGSNEILTLNVNRTSAIKTYNAYINNNLQFSGIAITEDNTYDFSSTSSAILGAYDDSGLSNHLNGKISEVVISTDNYTTPERIGLEQEQAEYYEIAYSPDISKINFQIDSAISTDYTLTFPGSQGSNNQLLLNDGSGNLSWSTFPSLSSVSLSITDTTSSTSANSGALIVSGGASIGEDLYMNGKVGLNVRTESTSTSLDTDYLLNMDNTGSATVSLPDPTDSVYTGVQYIIVKTNTSPGLLDITDSTYDGTNGGIIVSGTATDTVTLNGGYGERVVLLCNGINWFVM